MKFTKTILMIAMFSLSVIGLSHSAYASDGESYFELATAAHQAGDFKTSLQFFKKAAAQGDARAQTMLGVMYEEGVGVKQDLAQAVKWYQQGVKAGIVVAQFNLGVMYYEGRGVAQNLKKAAQLYQQAANQGLPVAQNNLAIMYATGEGVKMDKKLAKKWAEKSCRGRDQNGCQLYQMLNAENQQ